MKKIIMIVPDDVAITTVQLVLDKATELKIESVDGPELPAATLPVKDRPRDPRRPTAEIILEALEKGPKYTGQLAQLLYDADYASNTIHGALKRLEEKKKIYYHNDRWRLSLVS